MYILFLYRIRISVLFLSIHHSHFLLTSLVTIDLWRHSLKLIMHTGIFSLEILFFVSSFLTRICAFKGSGFDRHIFLFEHAVLVFKFSLKQAIFDNGELQTSNKPRLPRSETSIEHLPSSQRPSFLIVHYL